MSTVEVPCPKCGGAIDVSVEWDNYGADADGRRGEMRLETEVVERECECDLSEEELDEVDLAASKQFSEGPDEDDYAEDY